MSNKLTEEREYLKIRADEINARIGRISDNFNDMNDKAKEVEGSNPFNTMICAVAIELQDMQEGIVTRMMDMGGENSISTKEYFEAINKIKEMGN